MTQSSAPSNDNSPTMIELQHISKSFGNKQVLRDIHLRVGRGESMVVIGGSGSGKSVMLKCILGLHTPDKGNVLINGEETTHLSTRAREQLMHSFGMLFQGGALFDSLPVWQNITFALKGLSKSDALDQAIDKLKAVGLSSDVAHLYPAELSGGMQKRVSLARAITGDPDIVFFDEPTTGLDPIMADVINDLIIKCREEYGFTTLTITHDMVSAKKIASRVAMLYQGKMLWDGKAEDIMQSGNDFVDQFVHGRAEGPIEVDVRRN